MASIDRTRAATLREDGPAALEWAACYLEHVGELPVLSRVRPGEIRSRLPSSPPEQGEPFSAVLRDLDEVLLPGLTHWQHPRYFAYFAVTASEPGILAELLAAALNPVAILWRTSPASTGSRSSSGCRRAGTATSRTARRPRRSPRRSRRAT